MGGENKLLLPWRGKRIIEMVVETLVAASLHEVVVVVGHQREQVETALRDYPVRSVVNERFDEGMASVAAPRHRGQRNIRQRLSGSSWRHARDRRVDSH